VARAVQRLRRSAEAIDVFELRKSQAQTADMGEVFSRMQGVAMRRDGGLGSVSRFSLNGLYDDQIRFFFDGLPFEFSGFPFGPPFGMANVPVNLVDRVAIYRGVVPIRFGADALGGAVNLVGPDVERTRAEAHGCELSSRFVWHAPAHAPSELSTRPYGFAVWGQRVYRSTTEALRLLARSPPSPPPMLRSCWRGDDAWKSAGSACCFRSSMKSSSLSILETLTVIS
jgi:vitamin B12 transporter